MEMWIVITLTLAAFGGIGALAAYKHFTTDYPEGKRHKAKWGKYRVNLVMHPAAAWARNPDTVANLETACTNALKALVSAHGTLVTRGVDVAGSVAPTDEFFGEFTVWVIPEAMVGVARAAYITRFDGIPTCVVSDKYVSSIIGTGEPVIHEACHVVLHDYVKSTDDHAASSIWEAEGGNKSLQAAARSVYLELRSALQAK